MFYLNIIFTTVFLSLFDSIDNTGVITLYLPRFVEGFKKSATPKEIVDFSQISIYMLRVMRKIKIDLMFRLFNILKDKLYCLMVEDAAFQL
jgi:uncharacterized membrane protein